jgi:hypothetical protein
VNHPTFEHCAMCYLDLWVQNEEELYDAVKADPSGGVLRLAAAHFKISRNFPGLGKPEVQETLSELLGLHGRKASRRERPQQVVELANAFYRETGKHNVSAASKLLWFRWRAPFVILDVRAKKALPLLGFPFERGNYEDFCRAWRKAYKKHRDEVLKAALQLPRVYKFSAAASSKDKQYVRAICTREWFLERVFDNFLWQVGANKKRSVAERIAKKNQRRPIAVRDLKSARA